MTKVVISFFIGVCVYLLGLAIFCIVKAVRYKRKYKKDLEAHEKEEKQSEVSTDTSKE